MHRDVSNLEFIAWQMYYARKAQREELATLMARHRK